MDKCGMSLFHTFIKAFIVLFLILIVAPFIVDHIFHSFSEGIAPGNNSVIVFKELIAEKEAINRFIESIIKLMLFM